MKANVMESRNEVKKTLRMGGKNDSERLSASSGAVSPSGLVVMAVDTKVCLYTK